MATNSNNKPKVKVELGKFHFVVLWPPSSKLVIGGIIVLGFAVGGLLLLHHTRALNLSQPTPLDTTVQR
jgi:hypothetical protein